MYIGHILWKVALKMLDVKLQDMKQTDEISGHEIADMKMQDVKMQNTKWKADILIVVIAVIASIDVN